MLKNSKKVLVTIGLMAATAVAMPKAAQAQQPMPQQQATNIDVSEGELEEFVEATIELQEVQTAYQAKMTNAITENGLEPQEFQQMAQAKQTGKEMSADAKKQESFTAAMSSVMALQQKMQTEQKEIIGEYDMTQQEYGQIATALRSDKELAEKFRKMMAEEQM